MDERDPAAGTVHEWSLPVRSFHGTATHDTTIRIYPPLTQNEPPRWLVRQEGCAISGSMAADALATALLAERARPERDLQARLLGVMTARVEHGLAGVSSARKEALWKHAEVIERAPATPPLTADDMLRFTIGLLGHTGTDEPVWRVIESLTRELAWHRMHMRLLFDEVTQARSHREQRGGQHAGVPRFATAPPSLLIHLEREFGRALGVAPEDVPLAQLVEGAMGETRPEAKEPAVQRDDERCRCGHRRKLHRGAGGGCLLCVTPIGGTACWHFRAPSSEPAGTQATAIATPQTPTIPELLAKVRARLGPAERGATCTVRLGTHATPPADVRWKRVYADGQCSDERWAEAETVEEALLEVLRHEDWADEKEPQLAGPPPAGVARTRANGDARSVTTTLPKPRPDDGVGMNLCATCHKPLDDADMEWRAGLPVHRDGCEPDQDELPSEDPRDYVGTDPLCACHPEHAEGQRCDRKGCTCVEYTPHPETPADVEETRGVICNIVCVDHHGKWPKPSSLRALVEARIGARFRGQSYVEALNSLKLTNGQWHTIEAAASCKNGCWYPETRGQRTAARNAEAAKLGRYHESEGGYFEINDLGRARLALGRGPR